MIIILILQRLELLLEKTYLIMKYKTFFYFPMINKKEKDIILNKIMIKEII